MKSTISTLVFAFVAGSLCCVASASTNRESRRVVLETLSPERMSSDVVGDELETEVRELLAAPAVDASPRMASGPGDRRRIRRARRRHDGGGYGGGDGSGGGDGTGGGRDDTGDDGSDGRPDDGGPDDGDEDDEYDTILDPDWMTDDPPTEEPTPEPSPPPPPPPAEEPRPMPPNPFIIELDDDDDKPYSITGALGRAMDSAREITRQDLLEMLDSGMSLGDIGDQIGYLTAEAQQMYDRMLQDAFEQVMGGLTIEEVANGAEPPPAEPPPEDFESYDPTDSFEPPTDSFEPPTNPFDEDE